MKIGCGWCAPESELATLFNFPALWQAYITCRKGKRGSRNTQHYEISLLDRLIDTLDALKTARWTPSRSVLFVVTRPKMREIHAADFSDRVVHHLLVPRLERLYEPTFIHDSYSNRKGKGTHAAVERLQHFMRKVTRNQTRPAHYLQLDIANFFNTIDRPTLWKQLQHRLRKAQQRGAEDRGVTPQEQQELLWLTHRILRQNPTEHALLRGSPDEFARIPQHKRLSAAPADKGLPIGNLTSQFFANVYLNELDQFIKHTLKADYYLRYVDDFILLHQNPEQLEQWRKEIADFLQQRLQLKLRPQQILKPVTDGADFLGYIVRPDYRLVRRRVVGHLRERLQHLQQQLIERTKKGTTLRLKQAHRQQLHAMLASYLAHIRHASSHNLLQTLWREFSWLDHVFQRPESATATLLPRWKPERVSSFASQQRWFKQRLPGYHLLIQRGSAFLVANHAEEEGREIPLNSLKSIRTNLRNRQIPHAFIAEEGYLKGGLKQRVLRLLWQPTPMI
ncbi:MAG: reverse transcriptase [Gammaproteobacteria bacterium]|jgi:hypothetical protein|nr:reverse transcriptase [Gammaproteobacteria bacterium]